MEKNKTVYRSQLAAMALIASLTFKVVMLPQYLSISTGNNAFLSVALMMAIDVLMFLLVFYVIGKIDLLREDGKWMMAPIMAGCYVILMVKTIVLFSETISYTSSTLFDQGRASFIILGFIPVIMYIVYKGGNNIARLSLIIMWVVFAGIAFALLFSRFKIDWGNILPIMPDGAGGVLKGMDKHYIWFGDFVPFLFFRSVEEKNKKMNRWVIPVTLFAVFSGIVMFYIVFTGLYGNAGALVNFAFEKMAVFNKISELIGATNFPTVITWILMSIIKLSLLLYAMTEALTYFIKKKWLALILNGVAIAVTVGFFVTNLDQSYVLATSWVRWVVAAVQYSVPIVLAIYVKVKYGKTVSA